MIVPPIALKHVFRHHLVPYLSDKQSREQVAAWQYREAHMNASVQALAWCLHRFKGIRALVLVPCKFAQVYQANTLQVVQASLEFSMAAGNRGMGRHCNNSPKNVWLSS